MVVIKVKSAESCPNNAGAEVFEGKSRVTASKENIADVDNKSLEAHVAASETPRPAFQELNVPHRYCKKKKLLLPLSKLIRVHRSIKLQI